MSEISKVLSMQLRKHQRIFVMMNMIQRHLSIILDGASCDEVTDVMFTEWQVPSSHEPMRDSTKSLGSICPMYQKYCS